MVKKVLVPLAQGCEELEAVTIIDILVRGGVDVTSASLDNNKVITASRGVQLIANKTLDEVLTDSFDMIVLPGGLPGADYLNSDQRIIAMLKQTAQNQGITAAICAAPKVLVTAGLLDNKKATSYPGVIEHSPADGMKYINIPVVTDGKVVTSRGPGTAIVFALELLQMLMGDKTRNEVETALVRS